MPRYALFKDGKQTDLVCQTVTGILITADMNGAMDDGKLKEGYKIREIPEVNND